MSCPSCETKLLAEWMSKMQTKLDTINDRTKKHTKEIQELKKQNK